MSMGAENQPQVFYGHFDSSNIGSLTYSNHVLKNAGLLQDALDRDVSTEELNNNRVINVAKRAIQGAIIAAEISPLNEISRYAVFGAVHGMSDGNSLLSGLAFGAATFVIEASASVAAADVMAGHGSRRVIGKMNDRVRRIFKRDLSKEISPVTQGAVAMVGGSAVLLAVKQVENPERSKAENRKFGIKVAGLMGGYFTAEGIITSGAANTFGWSKTVAGGLVALAGAQMGYNKFLKRKEE